MVACKNLSGVLGTLTAVIMSSVVVGLILLTNAFSENVLYDWKTDTICTYDAKSNTTPEYSNCIKLSNVIDVYSSKDFVFVFTKSTEYGSVSMYVFDLRDKNIINNTFIYDKNPTPIVKYRMVSALSGNPTAICADKNLFAYGTSDYNFVILDDLKKTGSKNLGGKISSCDISNENIVVCAGNSIYVMNKNGDIKWSKELNSCKAVKVLNDNIFAGSDDKFFVFSKDGKEIFSKNINVKEIAGTDKIAVMSSDGIYIYNEDSKNLEKLMSDEAVIGITGMSNAIVYITPLTLRVVKYDGSMIYNYTMKPSETEKIVSIKGDKNYAVALTNTKDPDMIFVELIDNDVIISKTTLDDINNKLKFYNLKDGVLIIANPDNSVVVKNFVGISAKDIIAKGENLLADIINVGASDEEKERINKTLNEMKKEFDNNNYEKVVETGNKLMIETKSIGEGYALEEKKETDNLREMASEKGMMLTTGIKLRYDNAIEKMKSGDFKGAINEFRTVKTEIEQYVRDKSLELLKEAEKRKSALDKFSVSTENITKLDEKINSEKDYVNAFVLLDDVKELDDMTKERVKELFDEAENAKEEAIKPWIMFGADVRDIEDKIREAQIAEKEGDYEKCVKLLSDATKEAKEYDVISKVQDVSVIAIFVGIIVLIILYIRRPKVKEE